MTKRKTGSAANRVTSNVAGSMHVPVNGAYPRA
jgi:hypothetical protein